MLRVYVANYAGVARIGGVYSKVTFCGHQSINCTLNRVFDFLTYGAWDIATICYRDFFSDIVYKGFVSNTVSLVDGSKDLSVSFSADDKFSIYVRQGDLIQEVEDVTFAVNSENGKQGTLAFQMPASIDISKTYTLYGICTGCIQQH